MHSDHTHRRRRGQRVGVDLSGEDRTQPNPSKTVGVRSVGFAPSKKAEWSRTMYLPQRRVVEGSDTADRTAHERQRLGCQ